MSWNRSILLAAAVGATACSVPTEQPITPELHRENGARRDGAREAVLFWNQAATDAVAQMTIPAPLPPTPEALFYAMTNGAMHDALNAIDRRYAGYAYFGRATGPVSAAAAVATAAHTVLSAITTGIANDPVFPNPAPQAFVQQTYHDFLATIPDGAEKSAGLALGEAAGGAMLAKRANDGSAGLGLTPYFSDGSPGSYRPTPPFAFDPANLTGLADSPLWGSVRTFVIPNAQTFRAAPPYGQTDPAQAVNTRHYARDLAEVRRLGGAVSERTPEQTDIAFFWMENSPLGWNRVARSLGIERRLDGWELARTFALLQLAEADAYLTSLESKFHYRFWRPLTAIRFGAGDQTWDVASALIGVPTPPVPDYPSAHATAGGAAAEVLTAVFGPRTRFSMESTSLPGKTRRFRSVDGAAAENARSRIYIGYHFGHATDAGLLQGRLVGRRVANSALASERR